MGDEIVVDRTIGWVERHGYALALVNAGALALGLGLAHFVWGVGWSAQGLPALIVATTLLIRWKPELWTFFLPAALLVAIVLAGATVQHGLLFCSEPTVGLPLPS